MNNVSIENIVLLRYSALGPGETYRNYINGRKVCGIVIGIDGCSEYSFPGERKHTLGKGEIALFSDQCSYVVANTAKEPFRHYTINFSLSLGHNLPADEAYLKPTELSPYIAQCEALLTLSNSAIPGWQMRSMAQLYNLLADILTHPDLNMINSAGYRNIFPAINYMDSMYYKTITINQLSELCAMSPTSFRRTFTDVCGTSPIEYLIEVRIAHAKELAQHTSLTIEDIASSCGFRDIGHFCRTFKKRTGKTCSEFRTGY